MCVQLAKSGAIVIGLARRVEKINELNDRQIIEINQDEKMKNSCCCRLESNSIGKIIGIKCDMENQTEIFEAFEEVKIHFNPVIKIN